jgi:hypothetical protein
MGLLGLWQDGCPASTIQEGLINVRPIGMKLPNFEFAIIDEEKLRDYCLNPGHMVGKHKAKVFQRRLDFSQQDTILLKSLILEKITVSDCIETDPSEYGRRFIVDIILVNFDKQASVRTSWIIKKDELIPRLTSCYVID